MALSSPMTTQLTALDLFAGTGWGVACKRLGIEENGVEIMPEAVATRTANGMTTIYTDVWDGLEKPDLVPDYDLLIASPPCQTFSLAGKGAGRAALDTIAELIRSKAYRDVAALRAFGESHDPRTALVLTPLTHAFHDRPTYVVLEQVPTVLPVWELAAIELRDLGYSVAVGVLNAEQYGVPQTRKRAILIARRDGVEARLPEPTHSRYYSRNPEKLDEGVLPWVSMAAALGWDDPSVLWTSNNRLENQSRRPLSEPAPTVTAGHDSGNRGFLSADGELRVTTPDEVAAIQSYPSSVVVRTSMGTPKIDDRNGSHELDPFNRPAHTLTSKLGSWTITEGDNSRRLEVDEASALQSYPVAQSKNMGAGMVERFGPRPDRLVGAPAFTIRASAGGTEPGGFVLAYEDGTTRKLTPDEASTLQSYEPPFVWPVSKSKAFLQIGNAVPPLLAQAVLVAALS